jgi:O-antigen/teichoic acid export membrane protein
MSAVANGSAAKAPRSLVERLVLQSSHYTVGSLLVTAASFISFPIFTRTFSVADYGAMNLIASLLMFFTGIGKLGLQHSIVRFHGEAVAGKDGQTEPRYLSTVLTAMFLTAVASTAGWVLAAVFVPAAWWNNDEVARLMLPLAALIPVRVMDSAVSNILRAQQRSVLLNAYLVLRKYLGIGLIVLLVYTVVPGLDGFFLGTFVVDGLAIVVVVAMLARRHRLSPRDFDTTAFRAMLAFGVPMIAVELASIILVLGDRYVIQALLGPEALGHYSAAYNLSQYVQAVVLVSVAQAVMPLYVRTWEEQGEEPTRRFIERALAMYLMLACAVLAGMCAVGEEVLTLLASDRYAEGAVIIPLLVAGLCIDGGLPLFAAGMYIFKQNRRLLPYVAIAAAGNVALNILFIPYMGLFGASLATLICYIVLAWGAWHLGARRLRLAFPFGKLLKFALMAAAMYLAVRLVTLPTHHAVQLALRVLTGAVVYAVLVVAFDRTAREALGSLRSRLAGGT